MSLNRWITKHIFTCMAVLSTHTSYKCIHLSGSSDDDLTDLCRDKLGIHNGADAAICRYNFPSFFFFFNGKAGFYLIFMSENIRIPFKNMVTCLYIVHHPNINLCFSWWGYTVYVHFNSIRMYMTLAKRPGLCHRQLWPGSWVTSEALYAISVP